MNDDKLREVFRKAHEGDRPPPFAVPEKRRRPFPKIVLLVPVVAALLVLILVRHKPAPDLALPAIHYPTDFLLPKPGLEVPEPTKGLLQ